MILPRQTRRARAAVITAAAVTALLALNACSSGSGGAGSGGKKISIGVLIPGSVSDAGYMQSAYEGLQAVKRDMKDTVKVSEVEQVPAAQYEQALIGFARSSDLVISVAGQTDAAVKTVAPMFPKVKFVEIGGPPTTGPNLAAYDPKQGQAAYLAGAAAALLSTTKKVGFVAGVEIPPIVTAANDFAAGAKATVPQITVLQPQYTGDFDDVQKAKEAVLADVGAGGDIFYQIENLGLQGMVAAAKQTGTHVIGGPLEQGCSNPAFIASTKSDIGAAVRYAVNHVLDGTWKAEAVSFGLESPNKNATGIEICKQDKAVSDKIAAIEDSIAQGKVQLQ